MFLLATSLVTCAQTTFLEDFSALRLNMDKDDAIERIGPPKRKEFHDEKDWWYYVTYEDGQKIEKMLVFKQGRLIYAGRVANSPKVKDAAVADKENQKTNEAIEAETERARVSAVPMISAPSPIQDDTPGH